MVDVNRIPGNIHFSFHQYENIVFQLMQNGVTTFDLSHGINNFRFDEAASKKTLMIKRKFRDTSVASPLDLTQMDAEGTSATFVYFLNVIRTVYNDGGRMNRTLNQYTASKYKQRTPNGGIPAVFVRYDIAPIYVYYAFRDNSIMHFLVRIIAIIGGVITVAGIIVSFMQNSAYHIAKSFKE